MPVSSSDTAGAAPQPAAAATPSATSDSGASRAVSARTTDEGAILSLPTARTSVTSLDVSSGAVTDNPSPLVLLSRPSPTDSQARTAAAAAAASAAVAPVVQASNPIAGFTTLLNSIVTTILNPFLSPAPATGEPFTPVLWAVLGFVRRNLFNQAPAVTQPISLSQTGQTVTGNIGVTDPEGDALTYTITQQPQHGTVTINEATGVFTYTPDDIDYDAVQEDSFTVSVADRGFNLLGLFSSRSVQNQIEVDVLNPRVERVILTMPAGVTKPVNSRYSQDGKSIVFSGTPTAGGRSEIYSIDANDVDGSSVKCLTCGASTTVTTNLLKPVPFYDGTGRIIILLNDDPRGPRYAVFEPAGYGGVGSLARIVPVNTPDGGGASFPGLPPGGILNRQREMRPSPDGTHVLFTRIVFGQTGNFQALPIVGALTANGDHYDVTNARVVWPTGESKQWTPDGKGVIIQGGVIDGGNVDDILVDLSGQTGDELYPGSPFRGTRVTGNLDYDEDIDMSPNKQWIAVGSTRGFEALTPITRIQRQNFLPFYVGAAVYDQYADGQVRNVSNQNWLVRIEDDLDRENGIPLFVQDDPSTPGVDEGDGWISRSMPSWNADGTAITFWESGNGDEHGVAPTESRIVIANLKYTTSVGSVGDKTTVFNPADNDPRFPKIGSYVAATTPLPPAGSYSGVGGGTAVVSDVVDPTTRQTTRTVLYTNYVNEDGLILNGTESSTYAPSQTRVTYVADIDVTDATGSTRGSLDANAVYTLLPTQSVSGYITSTLDGDTQTIPDPAKVEATKTGA
ncbi:hypothetical protein LV457_07915 [Mycobacterium sp. MYCO198283]|uniref:Ig-like domain-containing protein n=1 Tax=Mycobacterium sp. MYCO198283 TaxID=2883505 RepID=UPI001E2CDBB2|nr:hypothetical protein [Mycobacterium sp. MYCO198283]MCG5432217.1 hypothetical protein [Mycobacterium sp. MYCO198283]